MLFSTFLWHKYTAAWPVSYKATIFDLIVKATVKANIVKAIVHISSSGVLRGNISWAQNICQTPVNGSCSCSLSKFLKCRFYYAKTECFCRTVCFQHHTNCRMMLTFSCNDAEVLILRKVWFFIYIWKLFILRLLTLHGILKLILNLTLMTVPCCFAISHTIEGNFLSIISASFRCCYLSPARWNFSQLYSALLFLHRFPPSHFACSSVLSQP